LVIHPENVFEMVKSGTYNFVQCVFKAPSGLFVDKEGERRSYTCFVSFPTEQLVLEVVYPSLAEKVLSSYRQNIELSLLLNLPTGEESLLFEPSETFKVDVKTEIRDGVAVAVLFARVANPVPGCKYRLSWIEC
jgi:hypothetical protein